MENELMDSELTKFVKGSNTIKSITREVNSITGQLNLSKEKLKSLESSFETPFNAIHIVEKASIPDNKSRPKRSIYVIAATLLTFIFTVMILILLHSYRNIDWKRVLKDE